LNRLPKHITTLCFKRYIPIQKGNTVVSRTIIEVTDDLDGSKADETIQFTIDGTSFEVDLSTAHAKELRNALDPYMKAGRKTHGRRDSRRRAGSAMRDHDQTAAIRDWAKTHGLNVSDRGRISAEVQDAYNAAH
jgi:nucleoid-associated protein Lsr2